MLLCPFCQSPVKDYDSWLCPCCGKKPSRRNSITILSPDSARANFPEEAFTALSKAEEGHFWFENRNRLIVSTLKRYVPGFSKYLEIGCGTGFVLKGIADAVSGGGATLYGSEFYQSGLNIAMTRVPHARFLQMDARMIPFQEEFDLLGAFDVLEHIEDDTLVLHEMAKALKPNGHILLTVPQHRWMWSNADTQAGHVRRYSLQDLEKKLKRVGFTIVTKASFVAILLPSMYLFRLICRGGDGLVASRGLINKPFSAVMTLERKLIELGFSFPVGGSLLVLAKKSFNAG